MDDAELDQDFTFDDGKKAAKSMKKKNKSGGFQSFGLSAPVFKAIMKRGYKVPTPIQRKTIPVILKNKDVVAMARTGSGKTAAFLIPMFEKLKGHDPNSGPRALILSPTRELALQTLKFTQQLGKLTDLISTAILGGERIEEQFSNLHAHPDIIIATPGRFMHLCIEMDLKLNDVKYVVFDEADRLFEMGFQEQLNDIIKRLPSQRQTLLFSATLSKILAEFAKAGLYEPELIRLDIEMKLNENLKLIFFHLRHDDKTALLLHLLRSVIPSDQQIVLFVGTRHHCEYLKELLEQQQQQDLFSAVTIYSTLDHSTRKINLARYQSGKARVLIVTDIAARGIDIPSLDNVINYHFPATPKLFLHRVGRVARAGRLGTAYSLLSTDELSYLFDVQEFIGKTIDYAKLDDGTTDYHLLFGNVPQTIIDEESETIRKITETNVDLVNLFAVQQNAYQHYIRSRPASTYASVKQMKQYHNQITNMGIHPIFRDSYTADELAPNALIQQLKSFRAKSTIFEVNPSSSNEACAIMRRKRAHDGKSILKHERKDQPLPAIQDDSDDEDRPKTLEVDNMTITVRDNDDTELPAKKKKKNRREVDKDFFIPYQPPDYKRERGLEIQSFERQTNDAVMDLANDDGTSMKGPMIQKTKWDRKKKKFVTVGQTDARTKKIKTESGQWIQASYKTDVYKKWLNKSKVLDKELPDSRRNRSEDHVNDDEKSSAQHKPRQFQQRVNQLMSRQKAQLKAKGQRMPSHSELKKPEQIVKKRAEKRQRLSLQRARQMRKGGRTNYRNKRHSNKAKHTRRVTSSNTNQSSKRTKKR
ncbi:unnamed protein product [Adineta ricciae]|uniref:RNA helicase n=1 Tax=Adineta ricciae TaxID=249248 RepID=A0A814NUJ9_ADIRI|nr:unnamed protein product [Adineta ricciae]CAF1143626.1 unnamed protein product [Adineta ricciae]